MTYGFNIKMKYSCPITLKLQTYSINSNQDRHKWRYGRDTTLPEPIRVGFPDNKIVKNNLFHFKVFEGMGSN